MRIDHPNRSKLWRPSLWTPGMRPCRPSRTWFEYAERLHYLTDGTRLLCADGKGLLRADGKAAITDGTAENDKCLCGGCGGCPEPVSFTATFSGVTLRADCLQANPPDVGSYKNCYGLSLGTYSPIYGSACHYSKMLFDYCWYSGTTCSSLIGGRTIIVEVWFDAGLLRVTVDGDNIFKGSISVPANCNLAGLVMNNENTALPSWGYGGSATITANY
jgi:hypothetical protein